MFTSIISAFTGVSIKNNIAMTGEITLRGRVLPIGGLKEKLLAAKRGGIKTVLIPEDNEEDLKKMKEDNIYPQNKDLEVVVVYTIYDILKHALVENDLVFENYTN